MQQQIIQASINICAKANYVGAGTVEFLLSQDGKLSFLEVNTRLQVEHPVTEETVGIDLIVEHLRIAQGLPLNINETPKPRGHAIEFRINAEDVANGFLPTPGTITRFEVPSGPGIRLDSGVVTGSTIPSTFDSFMAKLIIVGNNHEQALVRAHRALEEFSIEGVASVLPFYREIIVHPDFGRDFKVHTRWIETEFIPMIDSYPRRVPIKESTLTHTVIEIDGKRCKIGLPARLLAGLSLAVNSESALTSLKNEKQSETIVKSPVSGNPFKWIIKEGQEVHESDAIGIMEVMKMEVQIIAHRKGIVKLISKEGDFVNTGDKVAKIN